MQKKITLFLFFSCFYSPFTHAEDVFISLDSKMHESLITEGVKTQEFSYSNGISLIKLNDKHLNLVSSIAHEEFNKCGGFIFEENPVVAALKISEKQFTSQKFTIKAKEKSNLITKLIAEVDHEKVKSIIEKLSSFQNRYYRSRHGVSSQQWIFDHWSKLAKGMSGIKVEKIKHSRYDQPSVILTIEGSDLKEEYIVLGGHGDSIEGWSSSDSMRAPGADDNASGLATLTEIIRILLAQGHRPRRTLQFISYAAEEVGLRGSNDIASRYARAGKDVKGVLQFDMTNYSSSTYDIVFIRDYTTSTLTEYLISLLGIYLPDFKWGSDRCGYACSDHASWYRNGFPVAFPFESTFAAHNKKIHTEKDTLLVSGDSAQHAAKFAKLGLAFALDATKD